MPSSGPSRSAKHLPAWLHPGYHRKKDSSHFASGSISGEINHGWKNKYEGVEPNNDSDRTDTTVTGHATAGQATAGQATAVLIHQPVIPVLKIGQTVVGNDEDYEVDHDCLAHNCQRIVFNVSGQKFETQLKTLERFPKTLLGDPLKRQILWDDYRQEYFIDRHRASFPGIIYFYQSGGRLHRPTEVAEDVFLEEIIFYQLGETVIREYKEKEGFVMEEKKKLLPQRAWQRHAWLFCEEPDSSKAAKIFAIASISCILVSIICFCMETIPKYANRLSLCLNVSVAQSFVDRNVEANRYALDEFSESKHRDEYHLIPNYMDPFFVLETICVTWFSLEFILRLVSCPSKVSFCKNIMNIFDLLAILPFFVTLAIQLTGDGSCETSKKGGSLVFVRVLRVFRIFKLSKHSQGLRILGLTIKTSLRELGMFFFFLIIAMVIFSSAAYYAESGEEDTKLTSIPETFWWAIITMTTVGYGDLCPVGILGKLVGTLCVIAGVLTIALPVPIVVANFNNFYRHEGGK